MLIYYESAGYYNRRPGLTRGIYLAVPRKCHQFHTLPLGPGDVNCLARDVYLPLDFQSRITKRIARSAIPPLVSLIGLQQCDLNLVREAEDLAENIAPGLGGLDRGFFIHRQHRIQQRISEEQECP
jgi:hypothetical protein